MIIFVLVAYYCVLCFFLRRKVIIFVTALFACNSLNEICGLCTMNTKLRRQVQHFAKHFHGGMRFHFLADGHVLVSTELRRQVDANTAFLRTYVILLSR
jgi:hypothetical protein